MKRKNDLSRQILFFMLGLTLCIILISVLGTYIFYAVVYSLPSYASSANDEAMTFIDWVWIAIASLLSFTIALFFALKLSTRILSPLNTVALSLQRITHGDLSARAITKRSHLLEINNLVSDFNLMAERLQVMDADRKSWNAAIAHELRTPVTILRGRLHGLVDGIFNPEPNLFKNLLLQTEGLSRLIEDLRLIGSADKHSFTIQIKPEKFENIVSKSLENFQDKIDKLGFFITKPNIDECIMCDSMRITQCLNIILDNIINYATPGEIVISYRVSENNYCISITDSGPGIDKDFQPYMFEPFQRGENMRAINPQGCGLGLSVARAIMQAHSGDVFYEMSVYCHSTFLLQWPLSDIQK